MRPQDIAVLLKITISGLAINGTPKVLNTLKGELSTKTLPLKYLVCLISLLLSGMPLNRVEKTIPGKPLITAENSPDKKGI